MSELENELHRVSLHIARLEKEISDYNSFFAAVWDGVPQLDDAEADPHIDELNRQLAEYRKEQELFLKALGMASVGITQNRGQSSDPIDDNSANIQLAKARRKLANKQPLTAKEVILVTGLKHAKVYAHFRRIGKQIGKRGKAVRFDPEFVADWLASDPEAAAS